LKKIGLLLCSVFLIASCKKNVLSNQPFELDRNITCNDLYDDGYKRIFGVDVILIGKKTDSVEIHYQIAFPKDNLNEQVYIGINEMVEINDSREIDRYEKYREMNPLELSDSIYKLAWNDPIEQKKDICSKGELQWRNYEVVISNKDKFKNKIDRLKYKILQEKFDAYYEDKFKVVNLKTKDTFHCYIEEREGKISFSSQIQIKNYE
tara:strand:+ start:289 stop:909 length:621 start_codon:yes stop_codon:yes gene_type:complete